MQKLLLFLSCIFLFLPGVSQADEEITVLQTEGTGITRKEAIQNGLILALQQAEGVSIKSQQEFSKSIRRTDIALNGEDSSKIEVSTASEGAIQESTQGLVKQFRILESHQTDDSSWLVTLEVHLAHYKTPGLSPDSRRKIAVIPFQSSKAAYTFYNSTLSASEVSRVFAQRIITELTQSRKFAVLDREYVDEFLKEKHLILSSDTPTSELMKVGEVLGVDYLLVGTLSEANAFAIANTIEVTGETSVRYSASFTADYRILVMATRQIKWSDTVSLFLDDNDIGNIPESVWSSQIHQSLVGLASKEVVQKALENIYPLNIVKIQGNGEIILNQGGVTLSEGDQLDVFETGEQVIDPYTKEPLGPAETLIGRIEVHRVIPKMSFARVINGTIASFHKGNICRRVTGKRTAVLPATGSSTGVTSSPGGGVRLPFD